MLFSALQIIMSKIMVSKMTPTYFKINWQVFQTNYTRVIIHASYKSAILGMEKIEITSDFSKCQALRT